MATMTSVRPFKTFEILQLEAELGKTVRPHRIVFEGTHPWNVSDEMVHHRAHYELGPTITVVRVERESHSRYNSNGLKPSGTILVWYVDNDG